MTTSLGSFELGTVTSEKVDVNAQLFEQPIPQSSANNTILLDLFGVIKTVRLSGVFINGTNGYSLATFVNQFVDDSSGAIRGNQSAIVYASSVFSSSIHVRIQNFSYTFEAGDPTRVTYDLLLEECAE